MSLLRRTLIALIATLAALPFLVAGPASAATPIHADMTVNGGAVQLTVRGGSLAVEDGALILRNSKQQVVERVALFFLDGADTRFPIAATVTGKTATLTPVTDSARTSKAGPELIAAAAAARPAARDNRSPQTKRLERDNQALQVMNQEISAAMTISSIIGMGIGVVIGAVVMGLIMCPTFVACIPGLILGGSLGGILGTVAGGGIGAVFAVIKYFDTISKPVP